MTYVLYKWPLQGRKHLIVTKKRFNKEFCDTPKNSKRGGDNGNRLQNVVTRIMCNSNCCYMHILHCHLLVGMSLHDKIKYIYMYLHIYTYSVAKSGYYM